MTKDPVTHLEIQELRRDIFDLAKEMVPLIDKAVKGDVHLSQQRVTLIRAVLNKVVPDVSASNVTVQDQTKDRQKLTRKELDALVRAEIEAEKPRSEGIESAEKPQLTADVETEACQQPVTEDELPDAYVEARRKKRSQETGG